MLSLMAMTCPDVVGRGASAEDLTVERVGPRAYSSPRNFARVYASGTTTAARNARRPRLTALPSCWRRELMPWYRPYHGSIRDARMPRQVAPVGHTMGGLKRWSPMGDNDVLRQMTAVRFDTIPSHL